MTHLACFYHAGQAGEAELGEGGEVRIHVAEGSKGSAEHGRTSVRVLKTRVGCANRGSGTMMHQNARALYKAEDEISISVGGCIERLNITPMVHQRARKRTQEAPKQPPLINYSWPEGAHDTAVPRCYI